jgi:hypothetical protein
VLRDLSQPAAAQPPALPHPSRALHPAIHRFTQRVKRVASFCSASFSSEKCFWVKYFSYVEFEPELQSSVRL